MTKLKKTLGLFPLTFYGVGMIFGAGIYSVIGVAAGEAKESLWLCFLLSGFIVFLTALSYAELSAMLPSAGAEFTYLRKAFPKFPSLAFSVSSLIALSGCATAATVSIAFAGYLGHFVSFPPLLVAFTILGLSGLLAIWGIQESSFVNTAFTLIEAAGLVLFIWVGFQAPAFGDAITATPTIGILSGSALVFFSFLGFENIANLSEEAKDPAKIVPRAIFISLFVATVIYVLVGLSATALLDVNELAKSKAPLAEAAQNGSPFVSKALGGIALFATANTALISLIVTARILFSMARKEELPKAFSKLLPKRKTPWLATLLAAGISGSLLPLGKVETVASISSLVSLVAFMGINVTLITLRLKSPETKRPFRIPFAIGKVPVIPVVAVLSLVLLSTQFEPLVYRVGLGAITLLFLLRVALK